MLDAPEPLDPARVPLDGPCLIEASAGTGKTWTITALYLRLIVEAGHNPRSLLVMTYTRAATRELKERIRARLQAADRLLRTGQPARSEAPDPIESHWLTTLTDWETARRRVRLALHDFDEAAIYTIHSFCQRVLGEIPFDSGAAFDQELIGEDTTVAREACADWWRQQAARVEPDWLEYLWEKGLDPDELLNRLRPALARPYLVQRMPPAPPAGPDPVPEAFAAARRLWGTEREAILGALQAAWPGLNRGSYKDRYWSAWVADLDRLFAEPRPHRPLFKDVCPKDPTDPKSTPRARVEHRALERFGAAFLEAKTKKGKRPPDHPFFAAADDLRQAWCAREDRFAAALPHWLAECLDWLRAELPRRHARRGMQTYDDLLLDLRTALAGPRGAVLTERLQQRYTAALVDEFQDTDPIQYDILRPVFLEAERPLFLVGDPKQAIYGFRGADLFAYLRARRAVPRRFTLDVNRRSEAALVRGLNTLLSRPANPFESAEIPFQPVRAHASEGLALDDHRANLHLWWLGEASESQDKGQVRERAIGATVAEIARLLDPAGPGGEAGCGGLGVLSGGDIAVLVRTHTQGQAMKRALGGAGIAAVEYSRVSVFGAAEASMLEQILMAIQEPTDSRRIKAALATEAMGWTAADLLRLTEDEALWEASLGRFQADRRRWRDVGFMPMWRRWMAREGVAARLLALPDGERRLTNLFHLAELLQAASVQQHLGIEGLVAWLAAQRADPGATGEAAELRLESDADRVKIVTLHASKGLEYPVVFCPFLWEGQPPSRAPNLLIYHDPADDHRAVLDWRGERAPAERQALAHHETVAEAVRLAYVGLTRARHRCYVVVANARDGGYAPINRLLAGPEDAGSATALEAAMAELMAAAPGAIRASTPPTEPPSAGPTAMARGAPMGSGRQWTAQPAPPVRLASFTGLLEERTGEIEPEPGPGDPEATGFRDPAPGEALPRGRRFGRCLHGILQRQDFTDPQGLADTAARELEAFGYPGERWQGPVAERLESVLKTPLAPIGVRLMDIDRTARRDELDFYFPVGSLPLSDWQSLYEAHGERAIQPVVDSTRGDSADPTVLRGFIDLVFRYQGRYYWVDYKSNWLGADRSAYQESSLHAAMQHGGYGLQALIYTLALHRFLAHRVPGYRYREHFGGAFFLFLRGMEPDRDAGIVFQRLPEALMTAIAAQAGAPPVRPPPDPAGSSEAPS